MSSCEAFRTEIDISINNPLNATYADHSFSSFTDGLEASRRNREHFVTNVNLEDERLWGVESITAKGS